MRVAVFVTNVGSLYGGGRLAALLLAHCLARAGAEVAFVTNARPVFYDELSAFSHPKAIDLYLTKDFHEGLPAGAFDAVILIPTQSDNFLFYSGARGFCHRRGARLVLFNFESPNWFNLYSPVKRDESMWRAWREATEDGCLILSNSQESMKYAKAYYVDHPERTAFDYWHQPINLLALDRVAPQRREDRVVSFVRVSDPHKGGQDLLDALSEDLAGFTLVMIVGGKDLDPAFQRNAAETTRRLGLNLEIRNLVSDTEKFVELKRARLLLYPSRFEGYGIPPIEALASATPCVAYDLPVFREVCGDALLTAPVGDVEGLRQRIREALALPDAALAKLPEAVAAVGSVEACGKAALAALARYLATPAPAPGPGPVAVRPRRPEPNLVGLAQVRLDPEGAVEIVGWNGAPDIGEVFVCLDGGPPQRTCAGLTLKDVAKAHPWIGRADVGFSFVDRFRPQENFFFVRALLLARNGVLLDWAEESYAVKDVTRRVKLPPAEVMKFGGFRVVKEEASAIVHGWVGLAQPPLRGLDVLVGARKAATRLGRPRTDVAAQIASFPAQAPGFVAYEPAPVETKGDATPVWVGVHHAGGVLALMIKAATSRAAAGVPESSGTPAAAPLGAPAPRPGAPPIVFHMKRATVDEFRVVEFEGHVLAQPRIAALRFFAGDEFLGEGAPDRLQIPLFEKNRAYGDVYAGFFFVGRTQTQNAARWRVELCYDDAVVEAHEGELRPVGRAEGPYGALAREGPDLWAQPDAGPVAVAIVDDPRLVVSARGAWARAALGVLRAQGRLALVLHGNPQLFRGEIDLWRDLADALLFVNALQPGEGGPAASLGVVLDALEREAATESFTAVGAAAARILAARPPGKPRRALDLATPGAPAPPGQGLDEIWTQTRARALALRETRPQADVVVVEVGAAALAAALEIWPPQRAPEGRGVFVDATQVDATDPMLARALEEAAALGRVAAIVDAPPLTDDDALRARLGLPPDAALVFPGVLHGAGLPAGAIVIAPHPGSSPVPELAQAQGAQVLSPAGRGFAPLDAEAAPDLPAFDAPHLERAARRGRS